MRRALVVFALVFMASFGAAGLARAAPPLEAYGRLPAVQQVALSPSGARVALIAADDQGRKLLVVDVAGRSVIARFPVSSAKIEDIAWAGDDHVLVRSSATIDLGVDWGFKHEMAQVLVVDLKNAKTFFVFQTGRVANTVFGDFGTAQVDGHWYGFFGGLAVGDDHLIKRGTIDLYRVDLDSGEAKLISVGSEDNRRWLVGSDGAIVATAEYVDNTGVWKLYAGGGRDKLLFQSHDRVATSRLIGLGATAGSFVYVRNNEDGGVDYLQTTGADEGKPFLPDNSVEAIYYDPLTRRAIGVLPRGEGARAIFFDAAAQKRIDAVQRPFAGRRVSLASFSADLRQVVVFTTGKGDSGAYWLVTGSSAAPLGQVYPQVTGDDVGAVSIVDYKAADGMALHGVLTLPPGRDAKGLPLVVLPHGGPQVQDRPDFDWWAQAFASRGYAVFQPNFRGSGGYGPAYVQAGHGEWGRKMQTDISDGVAELARRGLVDPKRACIVGGSYGGYAALAGVTVQQGLYRCAVSWGGVSDPQGMLRRSGEGGAANAETRYWKMFIGARDAVADGGIKAISPLALAERADAPVLLMHGKDDTVVPIEQSRDMAKALKRAGKPYEFQEFPEDHWLSTGEQRTAMLKAAVAYVLRYNPPE